MTIKTTSPVTYCMQDVFKDNVLCIEEDKIVVKNNLNYDDIKALQRVFGEEKKIIFQERDNNCSICGEEMDLDGFGTRNINKNNVIYVQKYKCNGNHPYRHHRTDLTCFVGKNSNFVDEIVSFNLRMGVISYCSLEKRSEYIWEVHGCKISRGTVYYHTEKEKDDFLRMHKLIISKDQLSGIYGYDEQFPKVNGLERMRMTIIDIETRAIISEEIVDEFTKEIKEKFIKGSLEGLPLKGMVTDGDPSYKSIMDDLGIPHKSCTFHIMQNLVKSIGKQIKKLKNRIRTLETEIEKTEKKIVELKNKKSTYKNKKEKIEKNKKHLINLKAERKEKKAELKDLENYMERISNIFKCEDAKNAKKRFKMFLNSIKTLPKTIASFIKRLSKDFDRAIKHISHDFLPNTNNLLERFYGFTLPKLMKKRYRTDKGLELQIELQKIRWNKRNLRLKS